MDTGRNMKVQEDVILREIAGECFLIPTGKTVLKYNGLLHVSPLEAELWECCGRARIWRNLSRR